MSQTKLGRDMRRAMAEDHCTIGAVGGAFKPESSMSDPTQKQIDVVKNYAKAWDDEEGQALGALVAAHEERRRENRWLRADRDALQKDRDLFSENLGKAETCVANLRGTLEAVRAELNDRADAEGNGPGDYLPNWQMRLLQMVDAALAASPEPAPPEEKA